MLQKLTFVIEHDPMLEKNVLAVLDAIKYDIQKILLNDGMRIIEKSTDLNNTSLPMHGTIRLATDTRIILTVE